MPYSKKKHYLRKTKKAGIILSPNKVEKTLKEVSKLNDIFYPYFIKLRTTGTASIYLAAIIETITNKIIKVSATILSIIKKGILP